MHVIHTETRTTQHFGMSERERDEIRIIITTTTPCTLYICKNSLLEELNRSISIC